MTTHHSPLPKLPLPAFPPATGANLFESYAMAFPVPIEANVRSFLERFDDHDPEWDYELFGPWARNIGYSLWLLGTNIDGGYFGGSLGDEPPCTDCQNGLALDFRSLSAEWAHMHPNSYYFDPYRVEGTGDATLTALARLNPPAPNQSDLGAA